jgi:hypothetical protein
VREVAMMDIMERLTNKPNWHKKVFDKEILSKWRKEALDIPDRVFWEMAATALEVERVPRDYNSDYENSRWGIMDNQLDGILDDEIFDFVDHE